MIRKYRIICLKRSDWDMKNKDDYISDWYSSAKLIYWMPNRRGYTPNQWEAGHYTLAELDDCAGSFGDWFLEPVWMEEEE